MDRDTATPAVEAFPGSRARDWLDRHNAVAAPSEHSHEFVWDLSGDAEGPFVTDVDGNVLLDFTCHIGAAPLGYDNPKILDRLSEFDVAEPMKIAGQDMYFSPGGPVDDADFPGSTHLMERIVDVTDHYGMDTVFLSNSGGEAVENALKICYDNADVPKHGITFSGSFHGRTLGTLSLTRAKSLYTRRFPEVSGIRELPYCRARDCDAETCDCGFFADGESRLSALVGGRLDPAEVAYIILEPVQGVGGYRFPSDEFMREVGRVSDEYDIPLVVDEIQSGVGRTGEWWASDNYPVEPDVIVSAKALRVGATVANEDLFPEEKNRLGSTWGGGSVLDSMMGVFTLDAIEEYDLLANARERGRQFKETVRDVDADCVTDVRGLGLMLAVEFDTGERRDAVVEAALDRGLLLLGCGKKTIRVLPPLDVTEREIDLGASLLCEAIREVDR